MFVGHDWATELTDWLTGMFVGILYMLATSSITISQNNWKITFLAKKELEIFWSKVWCLTVKYFCLSPFAVHPMAKWTSSFILSPSWASKWKMSLWAQHWDKLSGLRWDGQKLLLRSLYYFLTKNMASPAGSAVKRICLQCRRLRRGRFNTWLGKIPWKGAWQPTPVFLPEESHGQRSLAVYSPWSCKESDRMEATEHVCTTKNITDTSYLVAGESKPWIFLNFKGKEIEWLQLCNFLLCENKHSFLVVSLEIRIWKAEEVTSCKGHFV